MPGIDALTAALSDRCRIERFLQEIQTTPRLSGTSRPARLTAALRDRYVIERELGAGGMATVYLARDVKHDRQVAVGPCLEMSDYRLKPEGGDIGLLGEATRRR